MVLYKIVLLAAIMAEIHGYVLQLNLKGNNSQNVFCGFNTSDYISFYRFLNNASTLSIQYKCPPDTGFQSGSAVVTTFNMSQSSVSLCLYNCSYKQPTITCTRQTWNENISLSQGNFVPIVSLNDSNPSDICVPTIWSEFFYPYVLNVSTVFNKTCVSECGGDFEINQTTTTQVTEGSTTRFLQTSTAPATSQTTETYSKLSTLSPAPSAFITNTTPSSLHGLETNDTTTKIIIGACVGGGLLLILCLVIIIVLICIKRSRRPHRKHSFTVSDNEINKSSKPKEPLVENKDKIEQEHPIVTSHIGNYINGIQIVNNKVDIPVNDYELPEYNTSTNSFRLNNTSNIKNNRISEIDAHLEQTTESSNVNLEQKLNENNSDTEDFGYSTTEDVSTKNDVYSKLREDAREFQNPYNVMPDDAADRTNSKSKPFNTERAQHEDNMPASANVQQVDDSHLSHPSSGDIYAQVVKIKL